MVYWILTGRQWKEWPSGNSFRVSLEGSRCPLFLTGGLFCLTSARMSQSDRGWQLG